MALIIIDWASFFTVISIVCILSNMSTSAKVSFFHCAALPTAAIHWGIASMNIVATTDAAAANAADATATYVVAADIPVNSASTANVAAAAGAVTAAADATSTATSVIAAADEEQE